MSGHYSKGDYSHLNECINRQALELRGVDEVFHALKRLIEAKDTEGAINMIDSHFKNQVYKGVGYE
ncbi:MAG: hypothetical protein COB36_11940 [Alphaproteobacteria bacterium]|nr:MAG: hypothetical protein COB36_11940 [Alphaproteobacteria bacterium]